MEETFIEKIGKIAKQAIELSKNAFTSQRQLLWAGFAFFVFISLLSFIAPPKNFATQSYTEIEEGATLSAISLQLKEDSYIKSRQAFEAFVVMFGRQKGVKAGEYFFEHKITSLEIAWRLVKGDTKVAPIPVTFFEGSTVDEMTWVLGEMIPGFDTETFKELAKNKEGYLFPDTYYFKRKVTPEQVIESLERRFDEKVEELLPLFEEFGRSVDDVVIMASIIEKEASRDFEEKRTIAGILWKRMSINMALQVDATLKYETGRGSAQLTNEDLRDDHKYNTYTNLGLPPTPIGNPGEDALRATMTPIQTDYLFYLHGKDGQIRYAETHDGHLRNKRNYLR
jgi:UPF0755 protein